MQVIDFYTHSLPISCHLAPSYTILCYIALLILNSNKNILLHLYLIYTIIYIYVFNVFSQQKIIF